MYQGIPIQVGGEEFTWKRGFTERGMCIMGKKTSTVGEIRSKLMVAEQLISHGRTILNICKVLGMKGQL